MVSLWYDLSNTTDATELPKIQIAMYRVLIYSTTLWSCYEIWKLKNPIQYSVWKQIDIDFQTFRIRISIVVHEFFSRMNISLSNKENSSFALKYHYIFLLRETSTINESNPGRGVHRVCIEKVGEYSVAFYLFKNKVRITHFLAIKKKWPQICEGGR